MVAEAPSPADFLIVTQSQESKSEVCAQEFYVIGGWVVGQVVAQL